MLEVGSTFLSFMITYVVDCILFKKLTNSSKKLVTIKNVLFLIIMSMISYFIDVNYGDLPKLVFCNIQICILYKLIFDKAMLKSILFTMAIVIVSNIAEFIFALIFIVGLNIDASYFTTNIVGYWIVNLSVTLLYYVILIIKPVEWIVQKSLNFFNESSKIETILLLLLVMFLIAGITYPIIVVSSLREKITYSLVFIAFVYFIGNFFYQRSKNGELKKE